MVIMIKKLIKILYRLLILYFMVLLIPEDLVLVAKLFLEFILFCLLVASFSDASSSYSVHKNVNEMTGIEFENYCAELLEHNNFYRITVTPPSNDYGADIVAYDKRGKRWVFQCKRFKGRVGNTAVQEVVAAKAHYRAEYSAVMTNSELTKAARQLAKENYVVLYEKIR